jgi:hypothetical protein
MPTSIPTRAIQTQAILALIQALQAPPIQAGQLRNLCQAPAPDGAAEPEAAAAAHVPEDVVPDGHQSVLEAVPRDVHRSVLRAAHRNVLEQVRRKVLTNASHNGWK